MTRLFFILFHVFVFGQNENYLSDADYEVINDIFWKSSPINNFKSKLYYKSDFEKSWLTYFDYDCKEILYNLTFIGSLENEDLDEILTDEVRGEIRMQIIKQRPFVYEEKKLNIIKTSKSYDKDKDLMGVYKMSKPIIVGKYAFIRISNIDYGAIIIAEKKDKWEIVRTTYLWSTLY